MIVSQLILLNWVDWYVHSTYDNIIILRCDKTYDLSAEVKIKLESEFFVTVTYSGINGDGIFFHGANLNLEEIRQRTIEAAQKYFEYE